MLGASKSASGFQKQIHAKLPDVISNIVGEISKSPSILSTAGVAQREQEHAKLTVDVNSVCKRYGGEGATQILDNFSMKVPSGAIYSLLGSSGCGKSSILSCIVGLKSWDSGSISVFGHRQSSTEGYTEIKSNIGYMPQELTLYEHLTVKEILQYFGKLYDFPGKELNVRCKELYNLLNLSSKHVLQIKNLSGGQKRRVSLALALVHTPKLLILDEPTVGLDPLLRTSIWEHLHKLVVTLHTTVLVTTHYLEESKLSNKIGIMRNGRMLVEDSPQSLLATYKEDLLHDCILRICKEDNQKSSYNNFVSNTLSTDTKNTNKVTFHYNGRMSSKSSTDLPEIWCNKNSVTFCGFKEKNPDEIVYGSGYCQNDSRHESLLDLESHCHYYGAPCTRFKKIMRKSIKRTLSFSYVMWIYLIRQPIFAFILLFMPAIQLFMTFYVVGREPTDLKVGVINLEALSLSIHSREDICSNVSFTQRACDLTLLSCHIQNYLSISEKLDVVQIEKKELADELVKDSAIFGYLTFPTNYSENLINRFMWGRFSSNNQTFDESILYITLDKSHYLAYHVILKEVFNALEKLSENLKSTCGFDQYNNEVPLHYREPVYGKLNGTYQDSIMPAIVAQILFEILYGIAPMVVIKDLRQGTFARSNLAGLRFFEYMLGIFVTMGPILLLQSISCYAVLEYGFGFKINGSFLLFIVLCFMAGQCGQGFGILVGIIVKNELTVIVSAIMVVPIIMTCSGTLWPLESHPGYLMIAYYIFPSALIVASLRSVVNRGVGITHALVWPGLANTLVWSVVFWVLSICGFKRLTKSS